MNVDFSVVWRFKDALLQGLGITVMLTLCCIVLGCTLGFVIGMARTSDNRIVRMLTSLYVEFFRGTPVIVQLFWIFFCLPIVLGVELSNFASAATALTLYMGAITSETFRSSLKSVGREQFDACIALSLPRRVQVLNILLPQALIHAVPTLLSNCVSLFKESALVSAVGMADLMFVGQNISNNTSRPIEVLTVVAAIYFVIAFPLTRAVTLVEKRLLAKLAA